MQKLIKLKYYNFIIFIIIESTFFKIACDSRVRALREETFESPHGLIDRIVYPTS